jgi:protein tyrosine phosphatase (PTP) superfamily phosphohydrolase (DUF442 family)/cytochrome c556
MRDFNHLVVAAILLCGGCARSHAQPAAGKAPPGEFHRVEGAGIENLYALGGGLYSGSSPEGDAGFATLKSLGIKTVLSVDGAAPDAALASKYGLHYVHIPVGYDGISQPNALLIVKAAETLPGPMFVHCHHGLHRGPAAAAIVCEGVQGWTPEQAEAWMHAAGTASNYAGLYRTVRDFRPPTESELRAVPAKFTSRARTPDLVNTMVQVDDHFDLLKAFQKAGFKALPEHPDAMPANESLILYELFREAHRMRQGAERGEQFMAELAKAETTANELHSRLKELQTNPTAGLQTAKAAFQNVTESCAACHKAYRN